MPRYIDIDVLLSELDAYIAVSIDNEGLRFAREIANALPEVKTEEIVARYLYERSILCP